MLNWLKRFFYGIMEDRMFGAIRSGKWPTLRTKWLKKNPLCEICRKKATDVHHIFPVFLFPQYELNEKNLASVCERCHIAFGHFYNYRLYNPEFKRDSQRIKQARWPRAKISAAKLNAISQNKGRL